MAASSFTLLKISGDAEWRSESIDEIFVIIRFAPFFTVLRKQQ